jgi:hypothetical protein
MKFSRELADVTMQINRLTKYTDFEKVEGNFFEI